MSEFMNDFAESIEPGDWSKWAKIDCYAGVPISGEAYKDTQGGDRKQG